MTATKFTKVYHFKCLPIETLLRHSRRGRCVYMWTSATGLWAKIPFGHKPQSSHLLIECKLSLFLGRSYTPAFLLPWVCSLVPRSLYSWSAVWLAGAPTHPGCEQGGLTFQTDWSCRLSFMPAGFLCSCCTPNNARPQLCQAPQRKVPIISSLRSGQQRILTRF